MQSVAIPFAPAPVPLSGNPEGAPWREAGLARIEEYPWYESGDKQSTEIRLLYDDEAVYLQARCDDRHISAEARRLNGPVYLDSCVEFFASPAPRDDPRYFNLEMNCCGAFLMGIGDKRAGRRSISADLASAIEIVASEGKPPRKESETDASWWVAVRLPFDVLSRLFESDIQPRAAASWRGNFYRCGGKTDPQYASWNPVSAPEPNFHGPKCFGRLLFGRRPVSTS